MNYTGRNRVITFRVTININKASLPENKISLNTVTKTQTLNIRDWAKTIGPKTIYAKKQTSLKKNRPKTD